MKKIILLASGLSFLVTCIAHAENPEDATKSAKVEQHKKSKHSVKDAEATLEKFRVKDKEKDGAKNRPYMAQAKDIFDQVKDGLDVSYILNKNLQLVNVTKVESLILNANALIQELNNGKNAKKPDVTKAINILKDVASTLRDLLKAHGVLAQGIIKDYKQPAALKKAQNLNVIKIIQNINDVDLVALDDIRERCINNPILKKSGSNIKLFMDRISSARKALNTLNTSVTVFVLERLSGVAIEESSSSKEDISSSLIRKSSTLVNEQKDDESADPKKKHKKEVKSGKDEKSAENKENVDSQADKADKSDSKNNENDDADSENKENRAKSEKDDADKADKKDEKSAENKEDIDSKKDHKKKNDKSKSKKDEEKSDSKNNKKKGKDDADSKKEDDVKADSKDDEKDDADSKADSKDNKKDDADSKKEDDVKADSKDDEKDDIKADSKDDENDDADSKKKDDAKDDKKDDADSKKKDDAKDDSKDDEKDDEKDNTDSKDDEKDDIKTDSKDDEKDDADSKKKDNVETDSKDEKDSEAKSDDDTKSDDNKDADSKQNDGEEISLVRITDIQKFVNAMEQNLSLIKVDNNSQTKFDQALKNIKSKDRSYEQHYNDLDAITKAYNTAVSKKGVTTSKNKHLTSVPKTHLRAVQENIFVSVFDDINSKYETLSANDKLKGIEKIQEYISNAKDQNEQNKKKFVQSPSWKDKRKALSDSSKAYDSLVVEISEKKKTWSKNKGDKPDLKQIGYTLDSLIFKIQSTNQK